MFLKYIHKIFIEAGYLNPKKTDRRTYLLEDDQLLRVPSVNPPPVPGAESPIDYQPSIKLPSRAPSSATSRPMKIWNAIWDDWYTKTGKVFSIDRMHQISLYKKTKALMI